jgi:hypothetical protein
MAASSPAVTCVCCGARQHNPQPVTVEHKRTGERSTMVLCPVCLGESDRTWHLTWRLVER